MKKITTIILVTQSVLLVLFLVYALVQRTSAIKNAELALLNEQEAVQSQKESMKQRQIAEANQAHAVELDSIANQLREELKRCQEQK